jgi:hypothetical protein
VHGKFPLLSGAFRPFDGSHQPYRIILAYWWRGKPMRD